MRSEPRRGARGGGAWRRAGGLGGVLIVALGSGCLSLGRMEAAVLVGHDAPSGDAEGGGTGGPATAAPVEARAADGTHLRGWVVPGRGARARGLILLVHGWGSDARFWDDEALALAGRGFDVAAFDLRGHGRSDGPSSFGAREAGDVGAELDALATRGVDVRRVILYGYSLGAVVAIRAAAVEPRVGAVLAVAPFARADDVVRRVARGLPRRLLDRVIRAAEQVGHFSLAALDTAAAARRLVRPLVVVAGTTDRTAPPADALAIAGAAAGPVELLVVPRATHLDVLSRCGAGCDLALGWLSRAALAAE